MSNSRRKPEFGLTDYLNQRTMYFLVSNKTEEQSTRLARVANCGTVNTLENTGR